MSDVQWQKRTGQAYWVFGEKRAIRFQAALQTLYGETARVTRMRRGLGWGIEAWAEWRRP